MSRPVYSHVPRAVLQQGPSRKAEPAPQRKTALPPRDAASNIENSPLLRSMLSATPPQHDVAQHMLAYNNARHTLAVQCDDLQYGAMQYDAMHYNATHYNALHYNAMHHGVMQAAALAQRRHLAALAQRRHLAALPKKRARKQKSVRLALQPQSAQQNAEQQQNAAPWRPRRPWKPRRPWESSEAEALGTNTFYSPSPR